MPILCLLFRKPILNVDQSPGEIAHRHVSVAVFTNSISRAWRQSTGSEQNIYIISYINRLNDILESYRITICRIYRFSSIIQ